MSQPPWLWHRDFVIPSHTELGGAVIHQVLAELQRRQWSERDCFGIHLALDEALINAIKHGNGMDGSKSVYVGCWLSSDRLRVEVRDEGLGFDPAAVPDPTADDRLDIPNGRGIMLMRKFMSRVDFSPCGNCVVMEKCRNGC